jgi:HEAT repeat protein
MTRTIAFIGSLMIAAGAVGAARQQGERALTAQTIPAEIRKLGSLDNPVRTGAARAIRRTPPEIAVPALAAAARSEPDEYVRYRALTMLTGFTGPVPGDVMKEIRADRNDRMRMVAYAWFEHHPEPAILPMLIEALQKEQSEFVRPALTRALAAQSQDPRARDVLAPLVLRGADFFRGAVIEALGDYGAKFAVADLTTVALQDGPLQDDAITALGLLGDPASVTPLANLQKSARQHIQPTISAALCLLGKACEETEKYLRDLLDFAARTEGNQALLRGAVHGQTMLAIRGRAPALKALLDLGVKSQSDAVRAPIALGLGTIALRKPMLILDAIEGRTDIAAAAELLRDAFDQLSEDFEEERFFVTVRTAYWAAAPDSPRRRAAEKLIEVLEF